MRKLGSNIYLLIFPILQFVIIPLLYDRIYLFYRLSISSKLMMLFFIFCALLYSIFLLLFLLSQKWFNKILFLISIIEILFLIILFKIYYPYYIVVFENIEFMTPIIVTVFTLYIYIGVKIMIKGG